MSVEKTIHLSKYSLQKNLLNILTYGLVKASMKNKTFGILMANVTWISIGIGALTKKITERNNCALKIIPKRVLGHWDPFPDHFPLFLPV
jgi:hypothetical protein